MKNPGKGQENWHSLSGEQALKKVASQSEGLSAKEASERLKKFGPNKLPEKRRAGSLERFLKQFDNILIYILIASSGVTAFMGHWVDTWVIIAVVLINAVIGFIQEGKAEKAMEDLKKMLSIKGHVQRDGKKMTIKSEELVPGDIVFLRAGDKIPADIRLLEVKNFKVEESALTGESVAVNKNTDPVNKDAVLGDRYCVAYSGTIVTYGNASGVVVQTGENTELGKINKMIAEVEKITTPLLRQIQRFGRKLAYIILSITALFFLFGYFVQGYTLSEIFLAVISMAVAAIPEGLPAIMTITLAVGVRKMAKRNAIIRKLPSVETLGSVTVICSDKTGTLTQNEMTAKTVVTADKLYAVEGVGYAPEGKIRYEKEPVKMEEHPMLARILQTVWTCNDAEIYQKENGGWELAGEPTEGALKTLGYKGGCDQFNPERLDSIPFESEHKFMATLNQAGDKKIIYIKGAPERLLELCDRQFTADGEKEPDQEFWMEKMQEIANQGQRLIAAAIKSPPEDLDHIDQDHIQKGAVFLGLIGIIDPPRKEVKAAMESCKNAGIQVKMITGDHAATAKAIAQQIGMQGTVISGKELEKASDKEMRKIAMEHTIFARTSPEHKVKLVKALQENNMICAMTGDGVNDAPALKRADIGVAMGVKGTEVAKDSAEMVLTDDNFASIISAVEEGRTVYDNIRKAILFILPTNGAESLVLMVAVLLGRVMPVTPAQILWVNMVTAVTLALALAFEPMERDVMKRPPRDSSAPIVGTYFIWRIIYVSILIGGFTLGFYRILRDMDYDLDIARTIAVNTLVSGQIFYLFNCRKLRRGSIGKYFFENKNVFYACGILLVLQITFTYAPFMNVIFETAPIMGIEIIFPLLLGLAVFFLVELEKYLVEKYSRR